MMMGVFKNIKPVFLVILIGCILICYGYLRIIGISDLTTMYQTVFGGKPLDSLMLKSLFIMIFLLLQYIHIDYITFFIDNIDHLSIRYGSKNNWLKALLTGALIITIVFVTIVYLLWLILDIFFGKTSLDQILSLNTIMVIGRIYLFCVIAVLAQIYLLLKSNKTTTFMTMGVVSIFLALTSHYQFSALYVLPQFSSSSITLLNVIGNIVLVTVLVALIKSTNLKKELSSNED